jgi:hypothetical protein
MVAPAADPVEAYLPDGNRAGREASAPPPEWLIHWLALLICCLLEPWNAVPLIRGRRLRAWHHDRPDLPAGSAQAYFASVRGGFGNSIRWLCLRHGVGPGHADWPEMSRAIVAFGGSLEGFCPGLRPSGLEWWENPGVIPGMNCGGFSAPSAATVAMRKLQAEADVPPPEPDAMHAEATHARVPASWLPASWRQVFARAGPAPSTGPPGCPGLPTVVVFDARGQSMAGPAVLIRGVRKVGAKPGAIRGRVVRFSGFPAFHAAKARMAGTRPAMTVGVGALTPVPTGCMGWS